MNIDKKIKKTALKIRRTLRFNESRKGTEGTQSNPFFRRFSVFPGISTSILLFVWVGVLWSNNINEVSFSIEHEEVEKELERAVVESTKVEKFVEQMGRERSTPGEPEGISICMFSWRISLNILEFTLETIDLVVLAGPTSRDHEPGPRQMLFHRQVAMFPPIYILLVSTTDRAVPHDWNKLDSDKTSPVSESRIQLKFYLDFKAQGEECIKDPLGQGWLTWWRSQSTQGLKEKSTLTLKTV